MSSPVRVLIVDDEKLFATAVGLLLETDARIDVVGTTDTAAVAFELVERERPDVVLMDLTMPGVDGFDATREIRARWPAAKVIVVSGLSEQGDAEEAFAAGASAFLLKGNLYDEIADTIVGVVD